MAFQERMSNSAYQRGMDDMKKAGLNPILAYKTGPASTPGGSSWQAQNTVAQGLSSASAAADIKNKDEQNNNLQANSALQLQQAKQSAETANNLRAQTRRTTLENDAYSTLSPAMRAVVLSGNSASSIISGGAAAAKTFGPAVGRGINSIKSFFGR